MHSQANARTRHSHRRLDGEKVEVGKKFSNGLRYPADPNGSYAEIMNCRCTLIAALDGIDDTGKRWSKLPEGMTYEQWKGEQLRKKDNIAFAKRARKPVEWNNAKVQALQTSEQVQTYASKHLGISALDSFSNLTLEKQKATVAGMQYAAERYGKVEGLKIGSFVSNKLDGKFSMSTNVVNISENCSDAFIAGFHEYIHAIDTEKSSNLTIRKSDKGAEWYNVYSSRVLANACKQLGVKRNSAKYDDALLEIFNYNVSLFREYSKDCHEIIARALEKIEFFKANELSKAIFKEFRND